MVEDTRPIVRGAFRQRSFDHLEGQCARTHCAKPGCHKTFDVVNELDTDFGQCHENRERRSSTAPGSHHVLTDDEFETWHRGLGLPRESVALIEPVSYTHLTLPTIYSV